jgi:hypothetical protein
VGLLPAIRAVGGWRTTVLPHSHHPPHTPTAGRRLEKIAAALAKALAGASKGEAREERDERDNIAAALAGVLREGREGGGGSDSWDVQEYLDRR